jgi:hypothetical protein
MIQPRFPFLILVGAVVALIQPSLATQAHSESDVLAAVSRAPLATPVTYYFSTSGDDANDGLSPAHPKRSLSLVPSLLRGCTTLLLRRGDVWSEPALLWDFSNKSGTALAPMRIGSYGEASQALPVVVVSATTARVIRARNTHFLTIENLELRGGGDWRAAVIEPPNSDIVFDNVQITRNGAEKASAGSPRLNTAGNVYYISALNGDDSRDG